MFVSDTCITDNMHSFLEELFCNSISASKSSKYSKLRTTKGHASEFMV